jgi:mannose-6-phosphate isomerase-like protein (cupin superfamily)
VTCKARAPGAVETAGTVHYDSLLVGRALSSLALFPLEVRTVIKLAMLVSLAGALALQGSAPAGVHVWKASARHDRGEALARKVDVHKVASETVAREGNLSFLVAHREGTGEAELHDTETDITIISEGQVTMVYGGTVDNPRSTGPGQTRGSGISGGVEVALGPGDIMTIPAGVPHLMKLSPGQRITYFVAKVIK